MDKKQIETLTKKEADYLCGHDGIRNEQYNMVGGIFYQRKDGKYQEIKDFREKNE